MIKKLGTALKRPVLGRQRQADPWAHWLASLPYIGTLKELQDFVTVHKVDSL